MAINKRATKKRRLKFINDDIQAILEKLSKLNVDLETEGEDGVGLITHISNIQIACDLNDNEPDCWKLKSEV